MGRQADVKMYCSIYTSLILKLNTEKNRYFFYSDPSPDPRLDLEAYGYSAFAYIFSLQKFQITTELWCLVVWSARELNYHRQTAVSY
jgi:hypothetical protein